MSTPITSQTPSPSPTGPISERPVCIVHVRPTQARQKIPTGQSRERLAPLARFHGRVDPIGKITANATIKGVKAMLKNGGPTESFRSISSSATNGQTVPTKTTKQLIASSKLLAIKALSRLTMANTPLLSIALARRAKRNKAPPKNTPKIIKMNTPRSGSLANACTEVSTPERTMKVPINEKPKAKIANNIVQALSASRFSTTMAECNSAAEISQGIKLAFSTGSQNQNPPHPSS